MASIQILKRRVRSVRNTQQITKAMELVAASKMRRVQEAAMRTRIYSDATMDIVRRLSASPEAKRHLYFTPAATKSTLYIIFNSDSGLAGAFNSNIFNAAVKAFVADKAAGIQPLVIAFGRKGSHHFSHATNLSLVGDYEGVADDPDVNVFAPVLETIEDGIKTAKFSRVDIIYTQFVSTMVQQVAVQPLLPIVPASQTTETENQPASMVFEFEPDVQSVLDSALRLYFESSLRRARVESAASEHAMRMLSMNSANRNAGDLIDNLTLELNATRQAAITQEMAEIIGGADAIA